MKFWLDALNWDKLEPMASGKVHIFLSAPNVFYANFISDKFKTEIEMATSLILGKSCEVSIAVRLTSTIGLFVKNRAVFKFRSCE